MSKKLVGIIMTILSISVISIGCSGEELSTEEGYKGITRKGIESIIHEKLDHDIDVKKDLSVIDLDGDNNLEYLVKYKTQAKDKPLRIMILSKNDDKLEIADEIRNVGEDFDDVKYIDVNGDGKKEIIVGVKAGENLSKGINIYEFNNGKAKEIFEEYYSDYIIENINNNGKKDIVLIKENEKDGKSYANLYVYKENDFKKVKKVEIDSTLDTEDEIIEKLLED